MNQPPKKRRFSFSLRTLMVFMLALCLLFGFIGIRLQRAREQQVFLRELRESGWSFFDADGDDVAPKLWDFLIGSSYLDRIELVLYSTNDVEKRPDIALLMELKNLQSLSISSNVIPDLTPLAELNQLLLCCPLSFSCTPNRRPATRSKQLR